MTTETIDAETGELTTATDPQAQAALFAKLAKVMARLSRLPKEGRNTHFNYDFVTDGTIADAVRPALADEGVAFFASMVGVEKIEKITRAHFVFTFADGETGATYSCPWIGEAIDTQDKGPAKAATSALKYFFLKTFVLSTGDPDDDTDGDAASKPKANRQTRKKAPVKTSGNGQGGKLGDDLSTQYWAKIKVLQEAKFQVKGKLINGQDFYDDHGKDFTAALKALEQLETEAA